MFRVSNQGQVEYITPARINAELDELVRNTRAQTLPTPQSIGRRDEKFEPPEVRPSSAVDESSSPADTAIHSGLSMYAFFFRPAGFFGVMTWLVLIIIAAISHKLPSE